MSAIIKLDVAALYPVDVMWLGCRAAGANVCSRMALDEMPKPSPVEVRLPKRCRPPSSTWWLGAFGPMMRDWGADAFMANVTLVGSVDVALSRQSMRRALDLIG